MRKYVSGIDHAVFAVHDLDAAGDTFERMGFALTPRGHHTLGSQNHCIMFGDDYLELLWLPPGLTTRPFIADFLAHGEGLAALALKTANAAAAFTELQTAGLEPTEPIDFSRPVSISNSACDAKFRTLDVGKKHVPCGRLFLCQHQTPDLVWRPEWQQHAVGAKAIAAVAVVAPHVLTTATAFARIFDSQVNEIAEGMLVETGFAPIAVTTGENLAKRLPGVRIDARPGPSMAALFIKVEDRNRAERTLRRGGFRPVRVPDGSIAIGATEAHGVAMIFG